MTRANDWSRSETLAALHLYLQLPYGQLHRKQPRIQQLANWIGRTSNSVALKLVNLASLDPQVVASGRRGMGHASRLDQVIWTELNCDWDALANEAANMYEQLAQSHGLPAAVDVIDDLPELAEGRTTSAMVQLRVNQARFRRAVLAGYNATCCISGLRVPSLLVASHIVPWSVDHKNRLNPRNGLCLSALHDRAYDQGLLTVLPDFTVRISDTLRESEDNEFAQQSLLAYDGKRIRMPERFKPDEAFLASHAVRFGYL